MTKSIDIRKPRSFHPEELMTLEHPEDVLNHPTLPLTDKRAILAEWASDAHSVPSLPALRQLPSGAIVNIDAILTALATLDEQDDPLRRSARRWPTYPRHRPISWRKIVFPRRDDDDDPPPAPAAALITHRRAQVA